MRQATIDSEVVAVMSVSDIDYRQLSYVQYYQVKPRPRLLRILSNTLKCVLNDIHCPMCSLIFITL